MDDKLTILYHLGQKLILLRDAQQIAEAVLDIAVQVLALQDSDFLLVDEADRTLYVAARRGQLEDAGALRLPLDGEEGITVAAARTGETIYVPDVRRDPRYVSVGFPAVSELAVPVQTEDRVLGIINAESTQPDGFDTADRELLSLLASQAALALENARLYARERHRAEEVVVLNELARQISASLDLQTTLDSIVAAAAELIPCALSEISLWEEETQTLTLRALQAEPRRICPLGSTYPPGSGYTGWLVRHKKPLLVPDVEARQDIRPHLLCGELPYAAYAGVPLMLSEEFIGILVLVANNAGAFKEEHIELLEALAAQASVAIHNARLYEEIARLYTDLAQRARELEAVQAVAAAVNCPGDLDEILREGLRQALVVTGLQMGAIALRDKEDGTLALRSQRGMSPGFLTWLEQELGRKALEGWPEGLDFQVEEIPLQDPSVPLQIREEGIRVTGEVPLCAEGELVGILSVATTQTHPFTDKERSLLRAIGHQLGTAIANAQLRQEALAAARLAAVGRVATSVAHDLRSPLGGIVRSAEFLAHPELSPTTRQKLSKAVVLLARRLLNSTQEILDYVRGERLPLAPAPHHLPEFLDEVLAVLEVDFADQGIEVVRDCDYEGPVIIDVDHIAQAIYNIAANARDAMPRGGTFKVTTRAVGERIELGFTDTGPGVPPEVRERIFEPFFTHGKREGAGLGLSIARRIVDEHGGKLWMESKEGEGATFVMSLPI